MASFIEGRSIKEATSVSDPIKHQTPLVRGRSRIPKEVVQQDLGLVGNKLKVKKVGTDIVELETLALVQGPVSVGQVTSQRENIKPDIMMLFPSFC